MERKFVSYPLGNFIFDLKRELDRKRVRRGAIMGIVPNSNMFYDVGVNLSTKYHREKDKD